MAADKGIACWGFDYETLLDMRREQIFLIGVYTKDDCEIFITRYENFFDEKKATVMNYEARNDSLQKYLPMQHFAKVGNSIVA